MDRRFDDTNERLILNCIKEYYPLEVYTDSLMIRFVYSKVFSKQILFNCLNKLLDKNCILQNKKGKYLFHKGLDKFELISSYCNKCIYSIR